VKRFLGRAKTRFAGPGAVLVAALWLVPACEGQPRTGEPSRDGGLENPGAPGLVGGDRAVWLIRRHAGTFDMVVRSAGERWRWVLRDREGRPAAAAALGGQLHLLSGPPTTYQIFALSDGKPTPGPSPTVSQPRTRARTRPALPASRVWPPERRPAAACAAPAFARSESPTIVAVVPLTPATAAGASHARTASLPARSPPDAARSRLGVFQTVDGSRWEYLTQLACPQGIRYTADTRVSAAVHGDSLFVLVAGPGGGCLAVWREHKWNLPALPPAPERPVAVQILQNRPVLISTVPAGASAPASAPGSGQPGTSHLLIRELDAGRPPGAPGQPRTITLEAEAEARPLVVPGDRPPLIASLGKGPDRQLAIFWADPEGWRFALCGLGGAIVTDERVTVLSQAPPPVDPQDILHYFMWALLLATLLLVMFRPIGAVPGPFAIPPARTPGSLLKRAAAFAIDQLPFSALSLLAFRMLRPDITWAQLENMLGPGAVLSGEGAPGAPGLEFACCAVVGSALWIAYGVLTEAKFGATLGKMILKLRVINGQGTTPTLRQAALRNMIKLVELSWPPLVPILLLLPVITRNRQRLGDMMARTAVVEKGAIPAPPPPRPDAHQ